MAKYRATGNTLLRPGMSRTPGLILAVITGVVGIAAVWAFSSFLRPQSPAVRSGDRADSKSGPAPVDLSAPPLRIEGGAGTRIQGSNGATVQWADKNDPSRLAGEMRYTSLEPLGDKRYNVAAPKGWMFLRDGGSLYLEAKAGNVFIADEQVSRRPDSGTLTGGVIIKVFKRKPDGSRPDPASDVAYATTTMDTLSFDGTTGEISTPDPIMATLENASFAGRGLTVIFNELRDRLEYLEIREGDRLVIKSSPPSSQVAQSGPSSVPATSETTASANAVTNPQSATVPVRPTATVANPVRTQYRAVFGTDVRLSQGSREIKSEQLEVFAVLLNGRFSPEAFGTTSGPVSDARTEGPATRSTSASPPSHNPAPTVTQGSKNSTTPVPPASNDQADVVLTWSGPLVARTVDESIAELVKDDVCMRFTSPLGGMVYLDDPATGAKGTAPVLNYFATRREIAMSAPQPAGVTLDLKDNGSVIGQSLALNLASGVAHARGPGQMTGIVAAVKPSSSPTLPNVANKSQNSGPIATASTPKTNQTIRWSEQADFMFAVVNGKVTNLIQEAILSGQVQARGDGSSLDAGWLRAVFNSGEKRNHLTLLEAKEKVLAADAAGATLSGADLRVTFSVSADGSQVPERVIARTDARATRGNDVIEGGVIDARVGLDQSGKPEVKSLTARESAHVQSADGVDARAHEILFDVPLQKARLTGRGNADATASKDATTITGPVVEVDGLARTIAVPGPGTLAHVQPALKDGFVPRVDARWSNSMTFDDIKGSANLAGGVSAVWMSDAVSNDKVIGQELVLSLTPAQAELRDTANPTASKEVKSSDPKVSAPPRELMRAIVKGDANSLASVESRRVLSPADRTLVSLTYVQGAVIDADNVAQTFTVPGAGKLLSVDRSKSAPAESSSTDPFAQSRGQGDALFTWSQSMTAYRAQDRAEMHGDVQVVHLRAGDAEPTELRSRGLTATLRSSSPAATSTAASPLSSRTSLSKLIASGNVWARSSTKREMTSDRMVYDAEQGVMVLTADNDRDVTVFDPAARAPLTSKAIEWDLKKDRVRIIAPGSISTGR